MIPAVSAAGNASALSLMSNSATRSDQPQVSETTRASAGETAASNIRLATANAVTAPDQTAVAPRLRDQETAERTERAAPENDTPTGPPPTFEESPLERQARTALEPPEPAVEPAFDLTPVVSVTKEASGDDAEDEPEIAKAEAPADPPPSPSERAEASFAQTKTLAAAKEPATLDVEI